MNALAFSQDFRYLATGSKNELDIWRISEIDLIPKGSYRIHSVIFAFFCAGDHLVVLDYLSFYLYDA